VFLLTTTAERFFPKFGFEQIARDEVPASVKASVEFRSACCASAIVMRKQLAPAR
jgi:amino-acid N-acetyltransferase